MRGSRGGGGRTGVRTPFEKSQNIGFHSITGQDPLKYHTATKPAFNAGQSSARYLPSSTKKLKTLDPSDNTF